MSDPYLSADQRSFQCPSCDGRIVIPINLPATTGPCPHCQVSITSPEPNNETSSEEKKSTGTENKISQESTEPINKASDTTAEESPTVASLPKPTGYSTAPKSESTSEKDVEKDVEKELDAEPITKPAEGAPKSKKKSKLLLVFLLLFVILTIGAIAMFAALTGTPLSSLPGKLLSLANKQGVSELRTPQYDWNQASKKTLQDYLNATTVEEKLPHILNAEALRPTIESFYKEISIPETDRSSESFEFIPLSPDERAKGFLLFASIPVTFEAEENAEAPSKILAFFKETADGPKLDWEVFAQTKYRTFQKFCEKPEVGTSKVFRILVKQMPSRPSDIGRGTKTYRFYDPVNITDTVDISVKSDSTAGRTFSVLRSGQNNESAIADARPATVELEWISSAEKPELVLKNFVCWEFANLGGTATKN